MTVLLLALAGATAAGALGLIGHLLNAPGWLVLLVALAGLLTVIGAGVGLVCWLRHAKEPGRRTP